MSWWSRLTNVVRSDRLDRDLEEEQRFHLESRADDLERRASRRRRRAPKRRGDSVIGCSSAKRAATSSSAVARIAGRDLRLGHAPAAPGRDRLDAAVLSLGLAIGACTAAFALIDALILRELPVRDPDRLVYLTRAAREDPRFSTLISYPFFERLRQARRPRHGRLQPEPPVAPAGHAAGRAAASRRSSGRSSSRAMPSPRSVSRRRSAASSARPMT